MKKLYVQTSPLTNKIYCGNFLNDNKTWASNQQDVTIEALVAVANHVLHFDRPIEISSNGKPEFRISVERL